MFDEENAPEGYRCECDGSITLTDGVWYCDTCDFEAPDNKKKEECDICNQIKEVNEVTMVDYPVTIKEDVISPVVGALKAGTKIIVHLMVCEDCKMEKQMKFKQLISKFWYKMIQRMQNSPLTRRGWNHWQHEDTGRLCMQPIWKNPGKRWFVCKDKE